MYGLEVSETNYIDSVKTPNKSSDEWVIRNLKRFGNCCIGKDTKHNLKYIEKEVGKIGIKQSGDSYILEVLK